MSKIISKNVTSAENQQERLGKVWWIVGFVDGEGTFSVSLFRNKKAKLGWQCFPEFVVTQGVKSYSALLAIKEFFGCGNIYINNRYDNHRENLARYCVRSVNDLTEVIIPFFNEFKLKTAKDVDFKKFSQIIELMKEKRHLISSGLEEIAEIISVMNHQKQSNYLESSEAIRRDLLLENSLNK